MAKVECQHIHLIEQIDTHVGPSNRKVTVGEAVQAMVLNALGFASRALYLTPVFFTNKPVNLLLRDGLQAVDLNDDSLRRALDRLYEAGVTAVFARVASHALQVYGLQHRFVNLDSTSVSLQGEYAPSNEDPRVIRLTHGYSKDHRPDLKQAVVSLICTYRSAIPVWLEVLSGNSADKTTFPQTIQAYVAQLQDAELPHCIADSALYSHEMLKALWAIRWITRVPETIREARALLQRLDPAEMQAAAQGGYRYCEVDSQYGGVPQRWLVIFSQQAYAREVATFQQQLRRHQDQAQKQLWHLRHREFAAAEAARVAAAAVEKPWRFHRAQVQLELVARYGRCTPAGPLARGWVSGGGTRRHCHGPEEQREVHPGHQRHGCGTAASGDDVDGLQGAGRLGGAWVSVLERSAVLCRQPVLETPRASDGLADGDGSIAAGVCLGRTHRADRVGTAQGELAQSAGATHATANHAPDLPAV